jgi:hypothetical protein
MALVMRLVRIAQWHSVGRRQYLFYRPAATYDHLTSRAKVQQQRLVTPGQVDVGGFDIPVQIVKVVHRFQAVQQRHKQPSQLVLIGSVWSLRFQMSAEVVTILVLHNHVAEPVPFASR